MTKYLADSYWASLPTHDYRARFFVESFREKLSLYSPHFAQARLMNAFGVLRELTAFVADEEVDERVRAYILSSLDELALCVDKDSLVAELFSSEEPIRRALTRRIKGGDFSRQAMSQLRLYSAACLRHEDMYSARVDAALRDAVLGPVNSGQIHRNLTRIHDLCERFVVDLLNRGYSPTHLFNRAEMFTRHKNFGRRTFIEQYDYVIGRMRRGKVSYEVVLAVQAHSHEALKPYIAEDDWRYWAELEARFASAADKLGRGIEPNIYLATTVLSTDHVSAAWHAKARLEQALDYAWSLERNSTCRVSSHATVGWVEQTGFDHKTVNVGLLQHFLTSEGGAYFDHQPFDFRRVERALNCDALGEFRQCFRHIRLSKESEFIEEKLLNMWIAFESMFAFGRGSIIENLLRYVPRMYATFALVRRLNYLKEMLVRNEVNAPTALHGIGSLSSGRFSIETTVDELFQVIRSDTLATALFESLGEREHLRFSVRRAHETFKSNAAILRRLHDSATDVDRQVRRIYGLRNRIAHTGYYGNVRPQLISHLYDYVVSALHALQVASTVMREEQASMSDLFESVNLGLDLVESRLQTSDQIESVDGFTPRAVG